MIRSASTSSPSLLYMLQMLPPGCPSQGSCSASPTSTIEGHSSINNALNCNCSRASTCRTERCPCSKANMVCKEGCKCRNDKCRNKDKPIGVVPKAGNDEDLQKLRNYVVGLQNYNIDLLKENTHLREEKSRIDFMKSKELKYSAQESLRMVEQIESLELENKRLKEKLKYSVQESLRMVEQVESLEFENKSLKEKGEQFERLYLESEAYQEKLISAILAKI